MPETNRRTERPREGLFKAGRLRRPSVSLRTRHGVLLGAEFLYRANSLAFVAPVTLWRKAFNSYIGTAAGVAFVLNWIWEMAQMPAFREVADRSWVETVPQCTMAAVGDVAVTLAIYGVGALVFRDARWGLRGGASVYASLAIGGLIAGVALEKLALARGNWSYSPAMPVIPGIEAGLFPSLQLLLLVPVSYWLAGQIHRRRCRPTNSHRKEIKR